MGTESNSQREQRRNWLEVEEAPPPAAAEAAAKKKSNKLAVGVGRWSWLVNAMLTVFIMSLPPLVVFLGGRVGAPAVWIKTAVVASSRQGFASFLYRGAAQAQHDVLLGGLLADGFDRGACYSRYQSAMYRRNAGRRPSGHLVSKLRSHEALQRRCGPGTAAYADALEQLKSGKSAAASPSPECRYLVSISYRGLGNRILAAASAFLYALLTDRVLLVDPDNQMDELFCEPFPNTTWLLPQGFPLWSYQSFYVDTAERYGKMRENGTLRTDVETAVSPPSPAAVAELPAFVYIHLDYNQTDYDQLFFCDDDQRLLSGFQWLLMRTDNYIVPGLFLVEAFRRELDVLFPEPDAVFHHLSRYLFHPTNHVWGLVTRYYDAHLAAAQRRVGIQARVFPWQPDESPELLEKITTCTQRERLLPAVLDTEEPAAAATSTAATTKTKSISVVFTSLKSWCSEKMNAMYWEHAAAGGEVVAVAQPSHEEFQRYHVKSHDHKAWAEMYLLSLTDMLVTTGESTFGYVAQGLAGLTPWVMLRGGNDSAPGWPCRRDMSMEPCFHAAPVYGCNRRRQDATKIVPHVQHCEDVPAGLKLVDRKGGLSTP